jgi:serine/threonine-protein kinase
VILLVALGIWALTQNLRQGSAGTARPAGAGQTTTARTGGPAGGPNGLAQLGPISTVTVRAEGYVGRAADQAVTQLRTLGLRTALRTTSAGRADPTHCVVGAVTPTGDVAIGTLVTVTCTPDGKTR